MRKLPTKLMTILAAGALALAPLLLLVSTAWAAGPICIAPGYTPPPGAHIPPYSFTCQSFVPEAGSRVTYVGKPSWHDMAFLPPEPAHHTSSGVSFIDALGLGIAGGVIGFAIAELAQFGWTRLVRSDDDNEKERALS